MVLKAYEPIVIQRLTSTVGRLLAPLPLTPNQWTVLSLLPAVVGFSALVMGHIVVGLLAFALAGAIDAIDGAVARHREQTSDFGAYLDGIVDRVVEGALLIGLMVFGYAEWILPGWLWLTTLLFFGTMMTSFTVAYADHRNVLVRTESAPPIGGLLERAERLLIVYASMVIYLLSPVYATIVIAIASGLSIVTVAQRLYRIKHFGVAG